MLESLLIANRGEIARRIMRTCRRLGVRTIAVYSAADAGAAFVREADEAYLIGPPAPRESYLDGARILDIAVRAGARAIHPGYGFLSENADFARACAARGVRFVGPPPSAIEAMGHKDRAKRTMEQAGVPVVPGYHGDSQDLATLREAARSLGYPLLVKAVAGGGGKGMRRVAHEGELEEALASARREAEGAFGDGRVLLERCILRPRHIEVQVMADAHGEVLSLFERDCSLQRRHQKVLEEAPAPELSPTLRAAVGALAVRAARAIDYEGAGTVELIAETSAPRGETSARSTEASGRASDAPFELALERIYFMEMNTRLQVEHPVTEAITGLDLVELSLRVASGEPLGLRQEALACRGHAIEVRLYAEDPQRGYLPQTGRLERLRLPEPSAHIRVDAGVVQGDVIGPHYDPMIAKLIAWGEDRAAALAWLARALDELEVAGLATNLDLLRAVAGHPAFAAGAVHTGFLEEHAEALLAARALHEREQIALAVLGHLAARGTPSPAFAHDPCSPWSATDAFRINAPSRDFLSFVHRGAPLEVEVLFEADDIVLTFDGARSTCRRSELSGRALCAEVEGRFWRATFLEIGARLYLIGAGGTLVLEQARAARQDADRAGPLGQLRAPMPGKLLAVLIERGARVQKGQALVRLEAMKMEHTLTAPAAGEVTELPVRAGEQVAEGALLLTLVAERGGE